MERKSENLDAPGEIRDTQGSMTRPHRRDANTKNGSVLTGLRAEPALAQALTDSARADTDTRGEILANIAREVRILLRAHLIANGKRTRACDDPRPGGWQQLVAGLKVEPALFQLVHKAQKSYLGWGTAACVRHVLRLRLGWSAKESIDAEEKFAQIAELRQGIVTP